MKTLAVIRDFLFKYGYIILAVCVVLLIVKALNQSNKIDEVTNNNKALNDTLHISYDKNKQQTATIQALTFSHVGDLQKIKSKDKTIISLQHYVDSLSRAGNRITTAAIIDDFTKDAGTTKTDIGGKSASSLPKDSVKNGITYVYVYPTYHTKWSEKWSVGEIYANKDSIQRNIKVINEYETSVGYTRKNIFNPWIPVVLFKNINPNTQTTDMRSVIVSPKTSRWGLGANFGGLYDPFNRKVTVGLQIGVNYNIITF